MTRPRLTRAQQALVAKWAGLAVKIAKEVHNGVPDPDAVSEGHVGLCLAAQRFDPARGVKFSTYAMYWVRACVMVHLMRSHGIPSNNSTGRVFWRIGRVERKLQRGGAEPTDAELAQALGVTEEAVQLFRLRTRPTVSVDDAEAPLHLAADQAGVDDAMGIREQIAIVRSLLSRLDDRERLVISKRWMGAELVTLADVARALGVSRERARQIEEGAMGKLRAWMRRAG